MARRGRPRKSGPRSESGRLRERTPKDNGTDQLQALREWFAGKGDPVKTTYPLGILLTNGAINERQHKAGCRFAWLYAVVIGRPSYAAMMFEKVDKGRTSPEDGHWLENQSFRYEALRRKLKACPARLKSVLEGVAVYERIPRWMKPVIPRISDVREAALLVEGLNMLDRHFDGVLDRAA